MTQRAARGKRAEKYAEHWLKKRGLDLVTRNFRCRYGELDLIMQDGATLVVVEVRARADATFLAPALSIDERKQAKIIRSTEFFLQRHPAYTDNAVRFDVVSLTGDNPGSIEWLRHAFTAD